jgi:hypothetical protein
MPLNIFNGSSWGPFKKIQIYDGSSWKDSKASYIWDGTTWKLFSTGVPTITTAPTFSQTAGSEGSVEQTLSITTGTWENYPTSYRYVWEVAAYTNGVYNWQPLVHNSLAQTQSTAYINLNYVGYLVRCKVYAINAVGESVPSIVEPGLVFSPAANPSFTAYPVSDGRIYAFWGKAKGATGYLMYYQGPNIPYTEILLPLNNEEPGTSVGTEFGNKYIDLGTSARGTLFIAIQPINNSNPFTTVTGNRMIGRQSSVSLSTVRTSTPPAMGSVSMSGTQSAQYPTLYEVRATPTVNSYGSPAGTIDFFWAANSSYNGGNFALFDKNGQTVSCTVSVTNSEGTSSATGYYTVPVHVPVITYGPCETYSESNFNGSECSGTYNRPVYTNVKEKRKTQYSDGYATGQYDYNCTSEVTTTYGSYTQTNGVCGYTTPPPPPACVCEYSTSPTDSFHFAPQCCPAGAQRTGSLSGNTVNACCPNVSKTATGTFACSSYDVNNSASTNYYQCFSVGACQAPRNPDGSRSACYS